MCDPALSSLLQQTDLPTCLLEGNWKLARAHKDTRQQVQWPPLKCPNVTKPLRARRRQTVATPLIKVHKKIKRTSLLDAVSLRVSNRNFRHFALFSVDSKHHNCPCVRCASAACTKYQWYTQKPQMSHKKLFLRHKLTAIHSLPTFAVFEYRHFV
jgi:hypothetical protein